MFKTYTGVSFKLENAKVGLDNIKIGSIDEQKMKNETLTTELHFELLKQYAWLSSATIGAIIFLAQLKAIEVGTDVYISLGFLALSILFSLKGQDHIVDSLLDGKSIYSVSKYLKIIRSASMLCLGMGVGFLSAGLF